MLIIRHLLLIACLSACAACSGSDVAPAPDLGPGEEPREEAPIPGFDGGSDDDDSGSGDAGGTPDMGSTDAGDEPDNGLTTCRDECMPGQVRCQQNGVQGCEDDPVTFCRVWGAITACGAEEACVDGACEVPQGCVDNDGDTYGALCDAGPDCDDSDASINPDGTETCDGADNDCDGQTDEDFPIGMSCTVGSGTCSATGTLVCAAGGADTECNASPPMGSAEVCDGLDNDCDGIVDNNGACTACSSDPNEPNDSSATASPVTPGDEYFGLLCPGETDWLDLQVQPNKDYRLTVAYPEILSDVRVKGYVDQSLEVDLDPNNEDGVIIYVDGNAGTEFRLEVINKDQTETFFRVGLVEENTVRCGYEDYFAPNQSIQTAFPYPANWAVYASLCHSFGGPQNRVSDWWDMGEIMNGTSITIQMEEFEGLFDDFDVDLFLWTDPDGDNVYTVEKSAETFSALETLNHTTSHTGRHFLELRDYNGEGADYALGWIVN